MALAAEVAAPVLPVPPEAPVPATGLASATEVASPVSPVLVALDWELTAPEAPEVAVGRER